MIKFLKKLFGNKKTNQYTVIIKKKHCIGKDYLSCTNCPLAHAIREQLPGFLFKTVGGFNVTDSNNHDWRINYIDWNETTMGKILSGKISECKVTLTY